MHYKRFMSILLLSIIPFVSHAEFKLNFTTGMTICSKKTEQQVREPYRYDPYSLGISRHPLRAMITPVGKYIKSGLEKRVVFTESSLQSYASSLKQQDNYVFARYYDVKNEQTVRKELFSLFKDKQKSLNTLIFAKDVIETLSPAKSLAYQVISQLNRFQRYWNMGQYTLEGLSVEKIVGSAAFVSDLKTLIANGGQFYYLEGIQELCSCEGFYLQRILYYRVNVGHGVRSAIVFAEKMPLYLQKTDPKTKKKEVILFQEPACPQPKSTTD